MGSGNSKSQSGDISRQTQKNEKMNKADENITDEVCPKVNDETDYTYVDDIDSESVDSTNSDDTYGLARRIPRYIAINSGDYHDDAIEMIAEENKNACEDQTEEATSDVDGEEPLSVVGDDGKESTKCLKFQDQNQDQNYNRHNSFEKDTIGYYITQQHPNDDKQTHVAEVEDKPEVETTDTKEENGSYNTTNIDCMYEEFKLNYTSRSRLVRKRSISNKQALILTKVGNRYKYITVPAYLPGQRVYSSRSFVKNHMTSSQYVYRRGRKTEHSSRL